LGKLTLEQVAEMAGVSRSTVSRVINNHPSVKPEVRQRVLEVVAQTGYQPDMAARSLAGQHTGIIGIVIPRAVQSLFTDPYFPRLIQGIAKVCNASDYNLSLFLFHTEEEERKLYPRVLRTQQVDGVIVTAAQVDNPLIPQLIENEVPFVMIGRPQGVPEASFVDVDNVVGAYTATSHLARLGYARIATITGPLNTAVGVDRRQGYVDALNDRNCTVDDALSAEGDFSEIGGYNAMKQLIPHKPDAVFVASDMMAFGALRALREAGLAVPGDVAVVGFDDIPLAASSDPPLTTVRQSMYRLGDVAAKTLIDLINNPGSPPRRIILATELVIRASCGSGLWHRDGSS
jgi:LacI family transcriptional regulator